MLFGGGADLCELGAQLLDFRIELIAFLLAGEGFLGALFQMFLERLQFFARHDCSATDGLGHALVGPCGTFARCLRRIGAGEPVAEVV